MKIQCAYDEVRDLESLVSNPKNPNKHPSAQIKLLAKIMKYQGWRSPIVISNRSGFITKGHGRLAAALFNKWTEAPVDLQDYASEADEYADMVADNKIAELADTDMDLVIDQAKLLGDFDLELLGIPDFQLPNEFEGSGDEDYVPEYVPAKSKLGDLYILGNHRLLCGDATNTQHVDKLMNGEKADMVFTDPPYGMNLNPNYSEYMTKISEMEKNSTIRKRNSYAPVIGDDKDFDPGIILGMFHEVKEVYLWGADYYCQILPKGGSWLVWDKTGGNESLDKAGFQSKFEMCWSKFPHRRKILRSTWVGVSGMSHKDDVNRMHPTQKPVKLCQQVIESVTGQIVVDLFGGSGSTLIACEKTNRKCFMMELDPHYCDVIVARWEKFTGQKAQLTDLKTERKQNGKQKQRANQI